MGWSYWGDDADLREVVMWFGKEWRVRKRRVGVRVKLKREAGDWPEAAVRVQDTRNCFASLANHQACGRGVCWLLLVHCGGDVHTLVFLCGTKANGLQQL